MRSSARIRLVPVALLIAVTPLIVRLQSYSMDSAVQRLGLPARGVDIFSLSKANYILLMTGLAVFFALIYIRKPVLNRLFCAAALLYALMIAVSTAFSEHRQTAVFGFYDRYEGMLILFCYLAICLVTYSLVKNREDTRLIVGAWIVSAVVLGLLGVSQFVGRDFFATSLGKDFIVPSTMLSHFRDIVFRFGKFNIYGTLYHPNYVGSYMAMAFPFSAALFIYSNRRYRIAGGLFSCLMLFNLLGCKSSAGMVGAFAACALLAVLCAGRIRRRLTGFLVLVLCWGCILFGMDYASSGQITGEMLSLRANVGGAISSGASDQGLRTLKDIRVRGREIQVLTTRGLLDVNFEGDRIDFRDAGGQKMNIENDGGIFSVRDSRFQGYRFGVDTRNMLLKMMVDKEDVLFRITGEGFRMLDYNGREIDPALAEQWGFEGRERMGTSRGYIWSRSLPLLRRTLLKGVGPDAFAYYFPQNDVVGKMLYQDDPYIVVDKPHDLYLQIAINTGLPSLLGFLGMIGVYLAGCLRALLRKEMGGEGSWPEVGLLASVAGYLIAAFFNDSVVSVAPVFWVLLGMGMALLNLPAPGAGAPGSGGGKGVVPLRA